MKMFVIKDNPTGREHEDQYDPQNSGQAVPGIDQQQNEGDKKDRIDPPAKENGEVIHRFMVQHAHAIRRPGQHDSHVGAQIAGNASIAGRGDSFFHSGQEKAPRKDQETD